MRFHFAQRRTVPALASFTSAEVSGLLLEVVTFCSRTFDLRLERGRLRLFRILVYALIARAHSLSTQGGYCGLEAALDAHRT